MSLFLKQKNNDSSEHYFQKTIEVIDSVSMQEGIEKAKEIETLYETEKKELQLQKQSQEIQAAKRKQGKVVATYPGIACPAWYCSICLLCLF